jgi:hypothetical protein
VKDRHGDPGYQLRRVMAARGEHEIQPWERPIAEDVIRSVYEFLAKIVLEWRKERRK